ncbi:LysM peptidoglycan-binding domain-containing protein [Nesterenkonia sp.]|uniref:LysM peptidoglycan-binding domain-containing protein n=1 Tax=Nesterenkonia sp. TaxID=704201 RepID=UPI00261B39ED|nr:LysM peptidoglycan-binding domain-containing protein [Nesterenkonia sp.]
MSSRPTILKRSTWTSQPKGFTRITSRLLDPADIVLLVPHYPAIGDVTVGVEPLETSCARIRGWRNLHIRVNGWADLGYPYVIDQAGRIFEGAGDTHAAAHAMHHNFTALGVLFIVGNGERPSAAARASFRALGRYLRATKFPNMRTLPVDHGNLPRNSTACAGQPIRSEIAAGRLTFGPLTGRPTPAAPGGTYTVQPGDTLSSIAAAHGTTVAALAEANGISNVNLIKVRQRLTIPSSSDSGGLSRATDTPWPGSALPQVFLAASNPFRSTPGVPLDNWHRAVPASHSAAFFEYLRRAGYRPTGTSKWAHEELARQWLLDAHRSVTQRADVRRHGNGKAFGNAASIWAAVQAVLAAGGLYSGAIDGQPGPATWWGLTERMNRQRNAYK